MPKKIVGGSNDKLQFTLPEGARALLDELVATKEIGGSHSEVIRHLVVVQLGLYRDRGMIGPKVKPRGDSLD